MSSHKTHPRTNVSRITTSSNMGTIWTGDLSGEDGNQGNDLAIQSHSSETPDRRRYRIKEDRDQVRMCIELSCAISDNNTCISIPQDHRSTRRTRRTYDKTLNPNTSFSDPVDVSLSKEESFDEDDMYGSDHGMETVSESSDDRNEVEISQSSEGGIVSVCTSSNLSNILI